MRSLENAAADYACLMNDLFSYQKEIEYEGEVHNGVLVVQNFFDVDYPTGVAIVHDLMNSRLRQFLHVAEVELPVLYDDFALDAEAREILAGYVREARALDRGDSDLAPGLPALPRGGPAAWKRHALAHQRSHGTRHVGGAGDPVDGPTGGQPGVVREVAARRPEERTAGRDRWRTGRAGLRAVRAGAPPRTPPPSAGCRSAAPGAAGRR